MGKDLTCQMLCDKLNISITECMTLDAVLAKRNIFAFHSQNAYNLRIAQLQNDMLNRGK